ncbi:MAG: hypothetical protein QXT05_02950 [Candidatus Bilamarchaeaceae archaeon]
MADTIALRDKMVVCSIKKYNVEDKEKRIVCVETSKSIHASKKLKGTIFDPQNEEIIYKIAEPLKEIENNADRLRYIYEIFNNKKESIKSILCIGLLKNCYFEASFDENPLTVADIIEEDIIEEDQKGIILLGNGVEVILISISALRLADIPASPAVISLTTPFRSEIMSMFSLAVIEKNRAFISLPYSEVDIEPQTSIEKLEILNDNEAKGLIDLAIANDMLNRMVSKANIAEENNKNLIEMIGKETVQFIFAATFLDKHWKNNPYRRCLLECLEEYLKRNFGETRGAEMAKDVEKLIKNLRKT